MWTLDRADRRVLAAHLVIGVVLGGSVAAMPAFSQTWMEHEIGRPSSTASLGYLFAMVAGLFGAGFGALLGLAAYVVTARAVRIRWWGVCVMALLSALVVKDVATENFTTAEASVRASNAASAPRVLFDSGAVVRMSAPSPLEPRTVGVLIHEPYSANPGSASTLMWNGESVQITQRGTSWVVARKTGPDPEFSAARLDYVRQILGVTVRFKPDQAESLVLLARLRATGRRELLVIFNASGKVVRRELLESRGRLSDAPVLWRSGPPEGPAHVTIAIGDSFTYAAAQ